MNFIPQKSPLSTAIEEKSMGVTKDNVVVFYWRGLRAVSEFAHNIGFRLCSTRKFLRIHLISVPYGSGAFFGVHAADKRSVTWW
jgi:hypothetical protein